MREEWVGGWDVRRFADPVQVLKDARECHQFLTHELAGAIETRRYNLELERKRMAAITWAVKNQRISYDAR